MRKGRTKRKPYFAEKEEQAVIDYITSNSKNKKNQLYNEILREPFRKMTQSILRKYPILLEIFQYQRQLIFHFHHIDEISC